MIAAAPAPAPPLPPGAQAPIIRSASPPQKQPSTIAPHAPVAAPIYAIPTHPSSQPQPQPQAQPQSQPLPSQSHPAQTPLQPSSQPQSQQPPPGVNGRPTPQPLQIANLTHRRRADPVSSSDGAVRARVPPGNGNGNTQPPNGNGPAWRQGKPIFEWLTRKLGARRASDAHESAPREPHYVSRSHRPAGRRLRRHQGSSPDPEHELAPTATRNSEDTTPHRPESMSLRSYSYSASQTPSERRREANNPYPSIPVPMLRRSYPASTIDSGGSHPPSVSVFSRSRTPSIASVDLARPRISLSIADDGSATSHSFRLAGRVADEDASVRPIPPSPTSLSVNSRSTAALYRSDSAPRRVRTTSPPPTRRDTGTSSIGASFSEEGASLASTKPTTVMSFESASPAHIAVAPSITSSPPTVTRTMSSPPTGALVSANLPSPISATFPATQDEPAVRVPLHSRYHPRNNPHPSAVPRPDASIVTLASSNFAFAPSPVDRTAASAARPGSLRMRDARSPSAYHAPHHASPTGPSVVFAERPASGSMYDGTSTHALSLSVRTRSYGRADDDASMRAIRRRGSWESGESRWSWRPGPADASMFQALNRRPPSELLNDGDEGDFASPTRASVYTRDSYRTALTWAADEEGDVPPMSESIHPHRPVSVKV